MHGGGDRFFLREADSCQAIDLNILETSEFIGGKWTKAVSINKLYISQELVYAPCV